MAPNLHANLTPLITITLILLQVLLSTMTTSKLTIITSVQAATVRSFQECKSIINLQQPASITTNGDYVSEDQDSDIHETTSPEIHELSEADLFHHYQERCSIYCEERHFDRLIEANYREEVCCCRFQAAAQELPESSYSPPNKLPALIQTRSMGQNPLLYYQSPSYINGDHSEKLDAPLGMRIGGGVGAEGPGIDLVALNRRRFEMDHNHKNSANGHGDLRRSEIIETNVATIPERFLSNLPEDVSKQIFESLSTDPTLMIGPATMLLPDGSSPHDPDSASVERLTKSCLTVHASSSKPEQLNVTFHLYTKNNPHLPFIIKPSISRLELINASPFQAQRPIKWITHGFHTNVDKSEWMLEAKDKILAFEDANVILTDWRRGASPTLAFYPKAAANAHVVAKLIVKILRRIKNDIDFSKIHLIGHSLGAHIMGFVGSAFTEEYLHQQQQLLNMQTSLAQANGQREQNFWQVQTPLTASSQLIGRITACDPALPCFGPTSSSPAAATTSPPVTIPPPLGPSYTSNPEGGRLEARSQEAARQSIDWTPTMWTHLRPDSAVVVEVMHSNPGVMGYSEPLGDFDFFPNGFERQPGCGLDSNSERIQQQPRSGFHRRVKRQLGGLMGNFWSSLSSRNQQPANSQVSNGPITNTLDRFIRPIRDFFHGYTCSHHRSVEYMVESMYYERIPQDRKLDHDFVCQMVGYQCPDYQSFKRGFCYKCSSEHDCRAFTMSSSSSSSSSSQNTPPMTPSRLTGNQNYYSKRQISKRVNASSEQGGLYGLDKFRVSIVEEKSLDTNEKRADNSTSGSSSFKSATQRLLGKRVLPTFSHLSPNYLRQKRSHYYFDTRPAKDFCLHHYHLLVKYRWFRVKEAVTVESLKLIGTLANISLISSNPSSSSSNGASQILLNKQTHQTYTMLLTEPVFLGQVEALLVTGDRLKSQMVEYMELTYMSNLDPRIRSLGSARLCRASPPLSSPPPAPSMATGGPYYDSYEGPEEHLTPRPPTGGRARSAAQTTLFVRCSGLMV